MSTTFYLTDYTPSITTAGTKYLACAQRGTGGATGKATAVTNTTASGTNIQVTQAAAGQALVWLSEPLNAVTISGTVTANVRGLESSLSANAGAGFKAEWMANDGSTVKGTIVADSTVPASITEYSTSDAAKNGTYTPTSSALVQGDRIRITLKVRNVGTMGGSFTVTNSYNGNTSGSAGDTFVTFTETITEYQPHSGNITPSWTTAATGTTSATTASVAYTAGQLVVLQVVVGLGSAPTSTITNSGGVGAPAAPSHPTNWQANGTSPGGGDVEQYIVYIPNNWTGTFTATCAGAASIQLTASTYTSTGAPFSSTALNNVGASVATDINAAGDYAANLTTTAANSYLPWAAQDWTDQFGGIIPVPGNALNQAGFDVSTHTYMSGAWGSLTQQNDVASGRTLYLGCGGDPDKGHFVAMEILDPGPATGGTGLPQLTVVNRAAIIRSSTR